MGTSKRGQPISKRFTSKTPPGGPPVTDATSLQAKLCLLPSPIDGYLIYAIMSVISCMWIIGTHYSFWRRLKKPVYIELDNLAKEGENLGDHNQNGKRIWRRGDIHGIIRDCTSLFIFVVIGFVLQIMGAY